MLLAIIVILMIAAAIFWLWQVAFLMRMSDGDFCGRFDKPLWVAILLFSFVLGALAFWVWKLSVTTDEQVDVTANALGAMIQKGQKPETPQ
jgi:hypothetical protein